MTSKIDSRTILGEQGAEQLLGKGDMLFMSSANKVVRIHAPYVSENEIVIGELVKKISNYKDFFAPVISICPINVSKIKTDVSDCNALKGKRDLVLMKMDYVKHIDLYDYLENKKLTYFQTWDQYALCINYLKLIKNKPVDLKNPLIKNLFKILTMNINPNPTKRYSIAQTIEEFKKIKKIKVTNSYGFGT